MPITDLTGTKWIFNDTITAQSGYGTFDLSAEDSEQGSVWSTLYVGYQFSGQGDITPADNQVVWMSFITLPEGEFTITGGTDATNASLIAWLEANGTLIPPTPSQTAKKTLSFNGRVVRNFCGKNINLFQGMEVMSGILADPTPEPAPDNAILTADNTYLVDSTGGYITTTEITLISFTFRGTTYQAESGMTWAEFINSQYNPGKFSVRGINIISSPGYIVNDHNGITVGPEDSIIANEAYIGVYDY